LLQIRDAHKNQTNKNRKNSIYSLLSLNFKHQVLDYDITCVEFTQDGLGAYIAGKHGNVKFITWSPKATLECDFDFSKSPVKLGSTTTAKISLSRDDQSLLVVSNGIIRVCNT